MSSNKRDPCKASTKFLGFLAFNGVFSTAIAVSLTLLVGAYHYPKEIGLLVLFPYYTYVLLLSSTSTSDGASWRSFSKNFPPFRYMREYLSLTLVADEELAKADAKKDAQFVFAVFPHGSNADFRVLMDGMLDSVLPGSAERTKTLAASVLFRIPLVREFALWTGCVDARRSVAESLLRRGRSIMVMPGGQAEQIRTVFGREIVYLNQRKGFIKIAIKHPGVQVVPVYAFGASDYYQTSSAYFQARLWLVKNLGISIPLAWGLWGSLVCPHPVPTTIVFGKPLSFTSKEPGHPTNEELDAAHDTFCNALVELFDRNKERLGYGDRKLEIL
jgi:1-acyl-sn-glycerol-3-phosphate acyltransferase